MSALLRFENVSCRRGGRLLFEGLNLTLGPGEALQHVTELEIQGVRNGDARTLLNSTVQFQLDEQVRAQGQVLQCAREPGGGHVGLADLRTH